MYQKIKKQFLEHANEVALIYKDRQVSYKDLGKLINETSDRLENFLGVKENDVILIAIPNTIEAVTTIYGVNKIGAICDMMHYICPFNMIINNAIFTEAKYLLLSDKVVKDYVEDYKKYKDKIYLFQSDDEEIIPGFNYFLDLCLTYKETRECHDDKKTSFYLQSGSTTGKSKSICLNSYSFDILVDEFPKLLNTDKHLNYASVLPLHHGFGLCMCMHAALSFGNTLILFSKFRTQDFIDAMNKYKIHVINGVPTIYEALLANPNFYYSKNIKDIYMTMCGGDGTSRSLKERWNKAMKDGGSSCLLCEGYGLTETVTGIALNTYEHYKIEGVGRAFSYAEFIIMDENHNILRPYEIGDVCIRSKCMMNGYLKDEEATKKTFYKDLLITGDLGYLDKDGHLYFKGRKKRVVKVQGAMVFPQEIEELVEHIAGVKRACAVGVEDERKGAKIKLFVIIDNTDENELREIILDVAKKNLDKWSIPEEIIFLEDFPETPIGKVDFNALAKM